MSKQKSVDQHVLDMVTDAVDNHLVVHEYMIRNWGTDWADEIGYDEFVASNFWLHKLKKRHDIVSRAVTHWRSRAERKKQEEIEKSIGEFYEAYQAVRHLYPYHLIWNMDQSPFSYEISNERTLAFKGMRDVPLDVESKNKNSHSYTLQATISRDGRLVGKLLLCLQETKDYFGPRVALQVSEQESAYGNIRVVCTTSGKMNSHLMRDWVSDVLGPVTSEFLRPEDGETDISSDEETVFIGTNRTNTDPVAGSSWASADRSNLTEEQRQIMSIRNASDGYIARPDILLLTDAWGGHSSVRFDDTLSGHKIKRLPIPPSTTNKLQPLDVGFFRQYKKLWKRIIECALHQRIARDVISRAGIINMHSLLWNQFDSPKYRDMLVYSWHNTDPGFRLDELEHGHPPAMVQDINLSLGRKTRCSVANCTSRAFIRCSHCERLLCLHHFLNRTCFHPRNETAITLDASTNQSPTSTTPRPDNDGSAGASGVAGAVGMGGAIITGGAGIGGGVIGSAAASSGTVSGASVAAASLGSSTNNGHAKPDQIEMTPLLPHMKQSPEEVVVRGPTFRLSDFVRDKQRKK